MQIMVLGKITACTIKPFTRVIEDFKMINDIVLLSVMNLFQRQDTQHNDIQHNDTQHKQLIGDTQDNPHIRHSA
jgi:hypothetical protein